MRKVGLRDIEGHPVWDKPGTPLSRACIICYLLAVPEELSRMAEATTDTSHLLPKNLLFHCSLVSWRKVRVTERCSPAEKSSKKGTGSRIRLPDCISISFSY